ncbi:MAG: hypothetical protein ACE5HS_06055 [bacterium]
MNKVEVISMMTFIFFIYFILAIFIERVIEILVTFFKYFEFKWNKYEVWNRKARKYQQKFERLYGMQADPADSKANLFSWIKWKVLTEKPYPGGKEIISAELIRMNFIRMASRIVAFLLALGFVVILNLDIIAIVENLLPDVKILRAVTNIEMIRILLTAALISIGSEPLHEVISYIEKIEKRKKARAKGGGQ